MTTTVVSNDRMYTRSDDRRARERAPSDAPSRQPPKDGEPGREAEVDLDVQRPGDDREINGRQTELVVTTVTVREKDLTLEDGR